MKIMKIFNNRIKDTDYYKYRINLPKKLVDKSDLLGAELKVKLDDGKLIIERNPESKQKSQLTKRERILQKELMKLLKK